MDAGYWKVVTSLKKVVMKNVAPPNAFFEMILAASVVKNWIPVDEKLLLVDKRLIPVTDNLIPDAKIWMPVDRKLLPLDAL